MHLIYKTLGRSKKEKQRERKIFLQPYQIVLEPKTLNMGLCSFWKPILENNFRETKKINKFLYNYLALLQAFVVIQTRQEDSLGLHFVSLLFFGFLLNAFSSILLLVFQQIVHHNWSFLHFENPIILHKWSKSLQLQLRKWLLYTPHPFYFNPHSFKKSIVELLNILVMLPLYTPSVLGFPHLGLFFSIT